MNEQNKSCADSGTTRREFLQRLGQTGVALGFMGVSLPHLLAIKEATGGVAPENALYDAYLSIYFEGGPSQTDTWDPKPGQAAQNVFPGINLGVNDAYGQPMLISNVFPRLATLSMNDPAIKLGTIRSFWHGSNDHGQGSMYMNGWWRSNALVQQYPSVASVMAYYYQGTGIGIPSVVINGGLSNRPNDAGQSRCPTALQVNAGNGQGNNPVVQALALPAGVDQARYDRRKTLLDRLNARFLGSRPDQTARAMEKATADAHSITSQGAAARAFDLTGKTLINVSNNGVAQRMTLAQELLKAGIPYVAMGIGGNDTHTNNNATIQTNWGNYINEGLSEMAANLKATGKRVLVTMYGDFGRTPTLNGNAGGGRDHWGDGFSIGLLSINQPKFKMNAIGDTGPQGRLMSTSGMRDPIEPKDLGAFVYRSLGFQVGRVDGKFDVPLTSRPAPPVDRINKADLLNTTFGLV